MGQHRQHISHTCEKTNIFNILFSFAFCFFLLLYGKKESLNKVRLRSAAAILHSQNRRVARCGVLVWFFLSCPVPCEGGRDRASE